MQALAIPANVIDGFVPYAWAHQVDQTQQRALALEGALTHAQQERDQLYESIAALGDDLDAARLRAAQALAETHRVDTELHALMATRSVRYTASLRNVCSTLSRVFG